MTQRQRLRELFEFNANKWISLRAIINLGIAMYPPRIKELREDKDNPMNIINKRFHEDGVIKSFYMYRKIPKEDLFESGIDKRT